MHNIISAISSGAWFIDAKHAKGYLPVAVNFLLGKPNPFVENMSENRELHSPYFVSIENPFDVGTYGEGRRDPDKAPKNSVAIMPIYGVITSDDQYSGPSGSKTKIKILDKIKSNDNIIGVIFDFDTPGGEAASTRQFSKKIKSLGKPTIGLVRNMSASAGYWLASACDAIFLEDQVSSVGSIGGYVSWANYTRYFQNAGVDIKTVYAKQSTEKNADYEKRDDDTADAKEDISELTQFFIDDVSENRKLDANSPALRGKMYRGQKAIDIGLAERFGSMEDAIKYIGNKAAIYELEDDQIDDINDDPTQVKTKNQDIMEIKIKNTWNAIKSFFGAEKTELNEDDIEKLNTKLQEKTDKVDQLTQELADEKSAHETTKNSLIEANNKEKEITTLNEKLAKKAGQPPASPENGGDRASDEVKNEIAMDVADQVIDELI